MGTEIWTHAFPAEPPTLPSFVPRRVLGALKVAMTRLAIAHDVLQAVEDAKITSAVGIAAAAYDTWVESRPPEEGPSAPGANY